MSFGCRLTESSLFNISSSNSEVDDAVGLLKAVGGKKNNKQNDSGSRGKSLPKLIIRSPRHVSDLLLDYPDSIQSHLQPNSDMDSTFKIFSSSNQGLLLRSCLNQLLLNFFS